MESGTTSLPRSHSFPRRGLSLLAPLVLCGSFAQAAAISFDGNGTGATLLDVAANWSTNTLPTTTDSATFTDAAFGAALAASLTNPTTSQTWGNIFWDSNSSSTFSGAATLFLSGSGGNSDLISMGSNASSGTLTIGTSGNALYRLSTGGNINVTNAGATLVIASQANLPNAVITKTGAGTLTFSNGNNAGGGVAARFVLDGGTLNFTHAVGFGGGSTSTLEIHAGTFLDQTTGAGITLNKNFLQTWTGDFTFKGTGQSLNMGTGAVTLSGGTRQITVSSKTLTQGGAIGDGGNGYGLTKSGTGTLTLTNINTYTGATTVSAGTLLLSGTGSIATSGTISVASGAILNVNGVTGGFALASGQKLMGTGTVTGALTVGSGATLAVGNSPGTMTFNNNLSFASSGTGDFEINGLTAGLYDLAQGGTGVQTVTFDGTLDLIFQAGFNTVGSVQIFNFENYTGNFSAVNVSGLAGGYSAAFNPLTGVVSVTAVPEPSSCALIAIGVGVVGLLRRKSRA